MTDVLERNEVMVPHSLACAWAQPAVQRLRHALLHVGTDPDAYLEVELEAVLLDGAWFTTFMSVPFTKGSTEGVRLTAALENLKTRFLHRSAVQDFVFKFWDPARVDEVALMNGGVDFDTAFRDSLSLREHEAKDWP